MLEWLLAYAHCALILLLPKPKVSDIFRPLPVVIHEVYAARKAETTRLLQEVAENQYWENDGRYLHAIADVYD